MRLLATATFFCMALAHIISIGLPRYFPLVGLLFLILMVGQKIYLPSDRWWYTIGCLLYLGSSGIASMKYGNTLSYAYVGLGALNYVIYPFYERIKLTDAHLSAILIGLLITCIPLSVGSRVSSSIYDNPNNYSAVVFATMYFGMLLFRGKLVWQLLLYSLFVLLIFLAASRSMLGAILMFGVLYFGQAYVLRRTLRFAFLIAFSLTSVAYYSLITSDEFKIMETIQANTLSYKRSTGLSHRDELFNQSLKLLKENPHGHGLGMSNEVLLQKFGQRISPHNAYLKIAVEGGVWALVGFFVLVFGFWLSSTSPLASSFLFALMIRGFFESATPLSLSLISGMFIIPMFLNENTVVRGYRFTIFSPKKVPPDEQG